MQAECRAVLLDIEGTTSSISFVYDEMFPFVRRHLHEFVERQLNGSKSDAFELLARDAGHDSFGQWLEKQPDQNPGDLICAEVVRLMDTDAKTTGLKQLQGEIWRDGFESGELVGHLYDDVVPAFHRWMGEGIAIYIYSSGSVDAQKLFFGHTAQGSVLPLINFHFDTKVGGKRVAESYVEISRRIQLSPAEILFVSDVVEELDAARKSGMQTVLSLRPGNPAITQSHSHPPVSSFDELQLQGA